MNTKHSKGRRRFLIAAGTLGGGLAVGGWWFYRDRDLLSAPEALKASAGEQIFNAWIKIGSDGAVVVQVPRQEMGQGISTALPMLVAEELDADPADMRYEQAPIDALYGNATMLGEGVPFRSDDDGWIATLARITQFQAGRALGVQATGGSSSLRDAWEPMRQAGATARAMLLRAAAQQFGVDVADCVVENSIVSHPATGARATFAELAPVAAALEMPRDVAPKAREQFKILGTAVARLDVPEKVDGSAEYGLDARPPGMLYGAIAQSPVFGGSVARYGSDDIIERPGIQAVYDIPATSTSEAAVVVVADHYWQAKTALDAMPIEWLGGEHENHDTGAQADRYQSLLENEEGRSYDKAGDSAAALERAATTVEANYHAPYLAHATMEPINCTTLIRSDGTGEVWVGNQAPSIVRWITGKTAGVPSENITVHTPYLGGGFGRRGEMDVVVQAAMVAARMPDKPVQLIWSREQDMQHDLYRPMGGARFRAGLSDGKLDGIEAKTVGQSCIENLTARLMPLMASDAMKDRTTAEGVFDMPYAIPHRRIAHIRTQEPIPVGFWRSVGYSHNAFFSESFIDECAVAANADPFEFRRAMLGDKPRHRKVLETAAKAAGWGSPLPANTGRGIALAESFGSIVAEVAEVEFDGTTPRVRRVVCAVDCGFAINPDTVKAQMESGIIFGLSAVLYGEITIKNGRVEQSNFPDYGMVTLANVPDIEVHLVESGIEHLGGIGEPGTPPIAPAVCNALYAASGKRVRALPIRV